MNYYKCAVKTYMGETGTYHRNYGNTGLSQSPKILDRFYTTLNNDDATTFS